MLIGFVDYLGIGLVYPIFAVLLFDTAQPILPFDASPEYRGALLGLLIALTPISQFFCAPLLGVFSDKMGRRAALIIGIGAGCLGYLLAVAGIYLNSLPLLVLYRILVGVSAATAAVAQAALADISSAENKAMRFACLSAAIGLGFTLGPFLGGLIADPAVVSWFNYSTPFAAALLFSSINLALVVRLLPATEKQPGGAAFEWIESIRKIGKVFFFDHLKWLFAAGFVMAFGWATFNEFIPLLLKKRFGFSLSELGEYYAFVGAFYALGSLAAIRFVHRFSQEKLLLASLILTAACVVSFTFIDSRFIWWVIPFMMSGLSIAIPTANAIVSNRAGIHEQGEVLGVYQSVGAAAMGLSPLLAGPLIGAFPALAAWGGAACFALAGIGFRMQLPAGSKIERL